MSVKLICQITKDKNWYIDTVCPIKSRYLEVLSIPIISWWMMITLSVFNLLQIIQYYNTHALKTYSCKTHFENSICSHWLTIPYVTVSKHALRFCHISKITTPPKSSVVFAKEWENMGLSKCIKKQCVSDLVFLNQENFSVPAF